MIDSIRLGLAGLAAAGLLTACSSSGFGDTSSAPAAPPTAPRTPVASGTPADAATVAAISRAYATFFDSTSTATQSQAALQHGEKFTKALAEQGKSSYAASSKAMVESASLISADLASVRFTITSGGSTLLNKAPGYAVKSGSTWQVAAKTFCALLTLQGDAPAACSDPSVTALPN